MMSQRIAKLEKSETERKQEKKIQWKSEEKLRGSL
jgi:hypothetical protein